MERLTGRRDGRTYIVGCPDFALPKIVGLIIQQTVDRLAAIEDILSDEYDLDRIRELTQADREGRCVVLPCKIFDKVWDVIAHYQFEVTEIDLLPYGKIVFRCGNKGTDDYAAFYEDDLGDTFVLAEPPKRDKDVVKEAEAALRRDQDG